MFLVGDKVRWTGKIKDGCTENVCEVIKPDMVGEVIVVLEPGNCCWGIEDYDYRVYFDDIKICGCFYEEELEAIE